MVIPDPAVICLKAVQARVERSLPAFRRGAEGRTGRDGLRGPSIPRVHPTDSEVAAVDRSGPGLADAVPPPAPAAPAAARLHASERRAQVAALRGLLLARKRLYGVAEEAFAEAASLDPALDLTAEPAFWDLPRGGQEAAVRAYEASGRHRDAAVLGETLRCRFRPRLVTNRRPTPGTD